MNLILSCYSGPTGETRERWRANSVTETHYKKGSIILREGTINPSSGFQFLSTSHSLYNGWKAPQDWCPPWLSSPLGHIALSSLLFLESASGPSCSSSFCLGHFLLDVHRAILSHSKSVCKYPLLTAAFPPSRRKWQLTTLIPVSISSILSNTLLLSILIYSLSLLLEHKLHEGGGFVLSTAGSLELRLVSSMW